MVRRKKPPLVPLLKCWITAWTALNACKLKYTELNSPTPTSFPFHELAASPLSALLPQPHRERCLSFLTQHTQTGHVIKQLQDLRTESQNLFFWWNEVIKDIFTLKGKRFYNPHLQICYVAWSCSLSCSLPLPKPCLQSENIDVLSSWITWFISTCKIFIRASIEKSLGDSSILQIGKAVAQKYFVENFQDGIRELKTQHCGFIFKHFLPLFFHYGGSRCPSLHGQTWYTLANKLFWQHIHVWHRQNNAFQPCTQR